VGTSELVVTKQQQIKEVTRKATATSRDRNGNNQLMSTKKWQ